MADVVKLDLKRQLKYLYLPSAKEITVVDVPEMQFTMLDGRVEPGRLPGDSTEFANAVGVLFGLSYTLKFVSKKRPVDPIDYTVMPLEGLWSTPQEGEEHAAPDEWLWTLMIMQPDHVTEDMFDGAVTLLKDKLAKEGRDGGDPALYERVRLERFAEGLCVQTLHLGPYLDEPRTLERMGVFADTHGYVFHGRHHEIYLGDPRAARPENLRTVLRHQVGRVDDEDGKRGEE